MLSMIFFKPTNTGTQKCVNLSLQNQHSHFLLNTLFRRVSPPPGLDQQNVNDNSVDYNHSPSGPLTSRSRFSYFYTLRRTLYLSRIFAEFSLKIFQNYCVQIAGKCVCEPKYRIQSFLLRSPQAKLSPKFLSSPPRQTEITRQCFSKICVPR